MREAVPSVSRSDAQAMLAMGVDFVPVYRAVQQSAEVVERGPDLAGRVAAERPAAEMKADVDHRSAGSGPASAPQTPVGVTARGTAEAPRIGVRGPVPVDRGAAQAAPASAGGEESAAIAGSGGPGPAVLRPVKLPDASSRARAQAALDALRARYERELPHASFIPRWNNIVFGEGDPDARLMFVGEAPGEEEDLTGRPFVGRAGQLLDKMIVAMGLQREQVYICNVLKVRPPGNATPTPEQARGSAGYLYEQISIVSPEVIVTLGKPAANLLLDTSESMGRLRGVWTSFPPPGGGLAPGRLAPEPRPVMPTYHPAYLLRQYTVENRRVVWSDLQRVVDLLGRARG